MTLFSMNTNRITVVLVMVTKMVFCGVFSIILTKNGNLEPLLIILGQIFLKTKKLISRTEEKFTVKFQELQTSENLYFNFKTKSFQIPKN